MHKKNGSVQKCGSGKKRCRKKYAGTGDLERKTSAQAKRGTCSASAEAVFRASATVGSIFFYTGVSGSCRIFGQHSFLYAILMRLP